MKITCAGLALVLALMTAAASGALASIAPRPADIPHSVPVWTADGEEPGANFGETVASAGDVNKDGYDDVLVTSPAYDAGLTDQGKVYLYLGSASGLSTTPAWSVTSGQAGAYLARAASAGDVNGDGYADVIVGIPFYNDGLTSQGRAELFLGSADGLSPTPAWTAESDHGYAYFGLAVGSAGDINHDGFDDVIVGAPIYTDDLESEGKAFLYLGSATGLSATPSWTAEGDQLRAIYGYSVGTAGDVNGDGFADVIVGSLDYDGDQINEGRAFVYLGSASGLSVDPAWTADGDQIGAEFGRAAATAGDVNGDGFSDVIVGTPNFIEGPAYVGRASVFLGSAQGLANDAAWTVVESAGVWDVSTAGDINHDGFADVIVGTPGYKLGSDAVGQAIVYLGSASGLSTEPAFTAESDQKESNFGWSVGNAGDVNGDEYDDVLVGAIYFNTHHGDEGRAFLYAGEAFNRPPDCAGAYASEGELWPPNRRLAPITVLGVTDVDGDAPVITISRVTQDEPRDGKGDGKTCPDGSGAGTDTALVRAERSSIGDGRVYRISFLAEDGHGDSCTGTVQVCVPHDRGAGASCGDDSLFIDSSGPCDSSLASPGLTVNDTGDESDARLGDGVCATAAGVCTLRAAIAEAGALSGPDHVNFDLPDGSVITLTHDQLEIADTTAALSIDGPGADKLAVDGNQQDRVLRIDEHVTAALSGLTLQHGQLLFDGPSYGAPGAGIVNLGTLDLTRAVVKDNTASDDIEVGGIANYGALTMRGCTVSGNSASGSGGGLLNGGTLRLVRTQVTDNTSNLEGGGLLNTGTAVIDRSTFRGNYGDYTGGGISNSGTLRLMDSTLTGNRTNETGGGLTNFGTAHVVRSTISGNIAENDAAVMNAASGTLDLVNSTVSGNQGAFSGGGISNDGTIHVLSSTISGNVGGDFAGGIQSFGGTVTMANSIVAGNSGGDPSGPRDCECLQTDCFVSEGYNLFVEGTGCAATETDLAVAADALAAILAPLQDNGGATETMALLDTDANPAVDGGNPAGCLGANGAPLTTDQRGAPRPSPPGGRCDIGSFELQQSSMFPLGSTRRGGR